MKNKKIDKLFSITVFSLLTIGLAVFISSSLGILNKNKDVFYSVLFSQLILGFGAGFLGMFFALKINYKFWRNYSFYLFLGSILLTAAVFIPSLGWEKFGAERWIVLGPISFQPVEFLKLGFIIYFSTWLSWIKDKVKNWKYGFLPLLTMLSIIAFILFNQPDTKSFILIAVTGMAMLFISGSEMRYIWLMLLSSLLVLGVLVTATPYLQARVKTFIDPSSDPRGASYQLQQSLIGIGAGGVFGRGYGQSIQKWNFLPEPQGDSIFAVLGEELGFVGASTVIFLYVLFALRGLKIANNSPDLFSRLFVSGIVIMITAQSFMNIASITGVFPLTGVPLPFMSHGGTSLMISLVSVGIIFNISKYQTRKNYQS